MLHEILHQFSGELCDRLRMNGASLTPPFSAIQISRSYHAERKLNLMLFSKGAKRPSLLLKVARSQTDHKKLLREFEILTGMRNVPALQDSVPTPYGLFTIGACMVLVEQFLPGTSLRLLLRRDADTKIRLMKKYISRALNWIVSFQKSTPYISTYFCGKDVLAEGIERIAPEYRERFKAGIDGVGNDVPHLIIQMMSRHGDFWPGNLLMSGNRIGVIDWEEFSDEQIPFHDMFLFLLTSSQTYRWNGWQWSTLEEGFYHAFLERSRFSNLVSQSIQNYFRALNVPPQSAELFFTLFLLEMAIKEEMLRQHSREKVMEWTMILSFFLENRRNSIFARMTK